MRLIIFGIVMFTSLTGVICCAEGLCQGTPSAVIACTAFFILFLCSFSYLDRHREEFNREIDELFGEDE